MRAIIKQCLIVLALCLTFITPAAQGEFADVVMNNKSEKGGVSPVIFQHWVHRIRFTCNVCHLPGGFVMRAGYNNITMEDITKGKFCGMCHNGKISWAADRCEMCHSGKPGLVTSVQRGEQTRGPAER